MPKWTDYTTKTEPADKDEVMILDTAGKANKRLGLSTLSDWIIGKIANKVFENLQTQNKTILGALNELNSNMLVRQSIKTTSDSGSIKTFYDVEGALLANVSVYSTPSLTEQALYIVGFSVDRGNANFKKISGTNDYIKEITCTKENITFKFTQSLIICRVLFIGK